MSKKQTIVFDIETIESITKTAREYQINLINSMADIIAGYKPGEMVLWTSGRRTGKSMYFSMLKNREYMKHEPEPKSKYQFSRAKWYTAPLNGNGTWRFSDEYNEIIAWCTEMFGAHPKKQDAWSRWYVGFGFINFRDAKDYEWYILRWS